MEIKTAFAPVLTLPRGTTDIDFYKIAFGATENFRLLNDDGSIHVAEFEIDGQKFHIHEMVPMHPHKVSPDANKGTTVVIGLFTADVHKVFDQAIAAGATVIDQVTDHEYGYRQGELQDPFGHRWVIQCHIPMSPNWKY